MAKKRLILLKKTQDLGSKALKTWNQVKKALNYNLLSTELVLLFVLGSMPITANAGVFSIISSFIYSQNAKSEINEVKGNLQNIPLLRSALNNDPNLSKGGGDIIIVNDMALLSEPGPSGMGISDKDIPPPDRISVYVVRKGDTLSGIASMFGVSVNTIVWANDIKSGASISPGQVLVILPISGVKYEVKKGDTLKSIVKKYKGDLKEVANYNGLTEKSVLAVGDVIIIPDGEVAQSRVGAPVPMPKSLVFGPNYDIYYLFPVYGGIRSQGLHAYNAVDISAPAGTSIVASASGQVIVSREYGWNGGYGNYIVIQHNNETQTLYSHNSRNIVFESQWVVQGQVIGYVGSTGKSTGSHVHFEVRGARNPF